MAAKHRKRGWLGRWRPRGQSPERPKYRRKTTVDMVDRKTLEIHLLAGDETRDPVSGRFTALCGYQVLPASIAEPGRHYCKRCQDAGRQLKITTRRSTG